MKYTTLGKTNLKVSVFGMGGHEFRWAYAGNLKGGRFLFLNKEREKVVAKAIESGINYFDTTFVEETQSLGHIIEKLGCKNDIFISGQVINPVSKARDLGSTGIKKYVKSEIDSRLKLLGREYFDIFVICAIHNDYDQEIAVDIVDILEKHREEGKFRYIGVSSHDHQILYDFLELDLPIDMAMFPFNYAVASNWGNLYDIVPKLFGLISQKDIGTVAMKCFVWSIYGVPFVAFGEPDWDKQFNLKNCVAWQTANSKIDTTVIGVETVHELKNNIAGIGYKYNDSLLKAHLMNGRNFEILIRNYSFMPPEIQSRMLSAIKQFTGQDFGSHDIEPYLNYWRTNMKRIPLPFMKVWTP